MEPDQKNRRLLDFDFDWMASPRLISAVSEISSTHSNIVSDESSSSNDHSADDDLGREKKDNLLDETLPSVSRRTKATVQRMNRRFRYII